MTNPASTIITFLGGVDSFTPSFAGQPITNLRALDLDAQNAATSAGLFAGIAKPGNLAAAAAGVAAGGAALATASTLFTTDRQTLEANPSSQVAIQAVVGDTLSMLGDATLMTSSFLSQIPAAKGAAAIVDGIGLFATLGGIIVNHTGYVLDVLSTGWQALSQEMVNLESSALSALANSSNGVVSDWTGMESSLQNVLSAASSNNSSNLIAAASSFAGSMNSLETSLFSATGAAGQSIIEVAQNNATIVESANNVPASAASDVFNTSENSFGVNDFNASNSFNIDFSASNPAGSYQSIMAQEESAFLRQAYYVVQSGDTASSIVSALTNGGITSNGLDAGTLQRINAVFGVSDFSTPGTLIHVPSNSTFIGGPTPNGLASTSGLTNVFDPTNNTIYQVGSSLDGHDAGALIIDTPNFVGNYPTFAAGTYSGVSLQPDGTIDVSLTAGNTVPLGTLAISPSGSNSLTLTTGEQISLPASSAMQLINSLAANTSPLQVIENYLTQLGSTETLPQLQALNDPTGSGVSLGGPQMPSPGLIYINSAGAVEADFYADFDPNSSDLTYKGLATVTVSSDGTATATYADGSTAPLGRDVSVQLPPPAAGDPPITYQVTDNVYFGAENDISHINLSNIQAIDVNFIARDLSMTMAQFNSLTTLTTQGSASITLTTGGTADFSNTAKITGPFNTITAQSWDGTTLIGGNLNGQILNASLFGNDTLQAGNGAGDVLSAGEGIDTLIGGTGGDTFVAGYGQASYYNNTLSYSDQGGDLAVGTVIEGNGSGNTLIADGDISGATITGIQT